jgi:hypothetical protein
VPPSTPSRPDPADDAAWAALRDLSSLDLEAVAVRREPGGDRPALLAVDTREDLEPPRVSVVLRHRGQRVERLERLGAGPRAEARAAARATVGALRDLLPPGVAEVHLDWVELLAPPTPNRPSVLHATVALRTAAGEELLAGSAVLRDEEAVCAARAVLDAVNRRLAQMTGVRPQA